MSTALRKERVGLMHAASMLKVTSSWLRHALEHDLELRGRPLPTPVVRHGGANRTQPYWELGTLMDFLDQESQ